MKHLVLSGVVATGAAMLLALAGAPGAAAPVPKGAGKSDPVPDLKTVFDTVSKAVKDEKWPAKADEIKLKDTARAVFGRVLKAAEQTERGLPVDFEKLKKLDVVEKFSADTVENEFVIADEVCVGGAKNAVLFASGTAQIAVAQRCIIVGRNVKCANTRNCVIISGGYVRLLSDRPGDDKNGSVLVAGQWIRAAALEGTICHVLHPGGRQPPDEVKFAGNRLQPAILTAGAEKVIFLNARDDTDPGVFTNCLHVPQKNPIAE
ncbi:MAG: hypothetical protein J0I06_08970 [Planctomycetes bacterium]|nr:hypothetical protein [Planctomycetota bacterium]